MGINELIFLNKYSQEFKNNRYVPNAQRPGFNISGVCCTFSSTVSDRCLGSTFEFFRTNSERCILIFIILPKLQS